MLHKGAEYIRQLRTERAAVNEQMDSLKKEIEQLTNSLK
jgi:MAX-like protein X